jgi:hypothetical protein
MTGSPVLTRDEPRAFGFPQKFMSSTPQQFGGQFASASEASAVDPSNLTMNGTTMHNFSQHLGHSYGMGNASIGDDELEQLLGDEQTQYPAAGFNGNMAEQGAFFQNQQSVSMPQQQTIGAQIYSSTPSDNPIASPFVHGFNYNQYRNVPQGMENISTNGFPRRMNMDRHPSDSRSPITPKTPGLGGLHIGTPESAQQAMLNQQLHHQAKSLSSHWNGTPNSGSWLESPLPSPQSHQMHHVQISEMLQGKHASVPSKMEGAHSLPSIQSQEAKKKRRRESHNLVERRRRDNINERIQDLSRLVPHHRLEDDKLRKHITANGPVSPPGISPPQAATSLLAGGQGRRATATGTITQGLPQDDKEKGPNKGDILNGAVSWMRDLMWLLYDKVQTEKQLRAYIENELGGAWPMVETEDDRRMAAELCNVVERNGIDRFKYSRTPGSGLRVPGFTNWAGDALDAAAAQMAQAEVKADPGAEQDFWMQSEGSGRDSLGIKEEEELGMDLG